jgi:hypothetical protein
MFVVHHIVKVGVGQWTSIEMYIVFIRHTVPFVLFFVLFSFYIAGCYYCEGDKV